MTPESDSTSKDFFQKRWHQPLYRLGKLILPILLSSLTIFLSFLGISQLVLCIDQQNHFSITNQMQLVTYSFACVMMGVVLAICRYLHEQRQQSRFVPIYIRTNNLDRKKEKNNE